MMQINIWKELDIICHISYIRILVPRLYFLYPYTRASFISRIPVYPYTRASFMTRIPVYSCLVHDSYTRIHVPRSCLVYPYTRATTAEDYKSCRRQVRDYKANIAYVVFRADITIISVMHQSTSCTVTYVIAMNWWQRARSRYSLWLLTEIFA